MLRMPFLKIDNEQVKAKPSELNMSLGAKAREAGPVNRLATNWRERTVQLIGE
jgi:hypothetical protein